jgi:hypothetical protein
MKRLILIGVVLSSAVTLIAQAPPRPPLTPADVSISGVVVDGVTGKPIAGVALQAGSVYHCSTSLSAGSIQTSCPNQAITTADGRFTFSNLPAYTLRLGATARGYLPAHPGQLGPNDRFANVNFTVAPGERLRDVVIKMWPPARISGAVVDDVGEPVVGTNVEILERAYAGTQHTWNRVPLKSARTDDRGRYSFDGVESGQYLVAVPGSALAVGSSMYRPTAFYPNATEVSSATVVRVSPGDELQGMNVSLARPSAGLRLAGRLVGPPDRIGRLIVRVVPADSTDAMVAYQAKTSIADADGRFAFDRLTPGRYRVLVCDLPNLSGVRDIPISRWTSLGGGGLALRPVRDGQIPAPFAKLPDVTTLWADETVELDKTMNDASVVLRTGVRIRGRVAFDFAGAPPSEAHLLASVVTIVPGSGLPLGDVPQSRVEADGSFTSIGLPAGSYGVSNIISFSSFYEPQLITSVRMNGVERIGEPIELGSEDVSNVVLTLTDKITQVMGTVTDLQDKPTRHARIIIFPRDARRRPNLAFPSLRLTRQVTVDLLGKFSTHVAPGDYFMAAIDALPADWESPQFLDALTSIATRVQIGLGEKRSVDLRVRALP